MQQTRREFVGTAVGLAALSSFAGMAPAFAATGPVRVPLSEFVMDQRRLDSLRRGIAAMKALPASDHRSWFFQASVHANNKALYDDAVAKNSKVANVDKARYWNKCPHFGACSADFLLWHRAYIFYFERHLRDAAQDADLAIPYWDYSKEDARSFPEDFAPQFLDGDKKIANSLYHKNREFAFVSGRFDLSAKICQAFNAVNSANFFHETNSRGFGGDTLDSDRTELGLLEQRPHNDIHVAVGGIVGSVNGAMSDIPTAAFDPIFWVHHANIDRMWAEWSVQPGKRWGPLPGAEWFDEKPWVFLDVDGSEKRESRRFYVERNNLAVRYDIDDPSKMALTLPSIPRTVAAAAPPPPGSAAPIAKSTASMLGGEMLAASMLLDETGPLTVSPRAAASRILDENKNFTKSESAKPGNAATGPLPKDLGTGVSSEKAPGGPRLSSPVLEGQHVYLELADISFDRVPSSGFAVYLAKGGQGEGAFVGLIDLFGATHPRMPGMSAMKPVQRFDVTRIVGKSKGPFTVRVEPYDLLVSKSGAANTRADAIHIGSIKFTVASE
ncbi:MAG: tyrosinase family protein [Proteobacteria bacterium]|nr:tyrosinase family protein [Pseudomonadota bacterium]